MALARARRQIPQYVKKFTTSDWVNNKIEVIRTGVPVDGQLGPHLLPNTDFFETTVFKEKSSGSFLKEVGIHIAQYLNGLVVIKKAPLAPAFDGVIFIRSNKYDP